MSEFNVIKRSGECVPIQFDEISRRNEQLVKQLGLNLNIAKLTQTVTSGLKNNITTKEIDHLSSETAVSLSVYEPEYDTLAARIFMDDLHKSTPSTLGECLYLLLQDGILHEGVYDFFCEHKEVLENSIVHSRDFQYSYFACKTLERGYLLRTKQGVIAERPQYMLMRVSLGIHYKGTVSDAIETYDYMSQLYFTHASPTLFNGGTTFPQLSSCFLLGMDDSLDSIYKTLHRCAMISKHGGGIGINISNVRSRGSPITSTNGMSDGIVPMIRVFNETARYVNQSGKRKGSFALYIEPWHPEIIEFLELRLNNGTEEMRARDLFTALWIPDLFMKRVKDNLNWTLFDPYLVASHFGKGFQDVYGKEFDDMYETAEKELAGKTVPARDIWSRALQSQMETGTPYLLYKDAVNTKNNQSNIGVIRGSNLCAEIVEYTDSENVSVCNLASIALNRFVQDKSFNYELLSKVVRMTVRNLNNIINLNYYPVLEAERTNRCHRPIGIGVQGLHDVFALLEINWDSEEAKKINRHIFETMYYHSTDESALLGSMYGSYDMFEGSPLSKGILQPDLWNVEPVTTYDWEGLRERVQKGMRNSLLLSLMPTATTSQILGNTEAIEPVTSNVYTRKVLAGDFPVVNTHLYKELTKRGLWTNSLVNNIIRENGSVQNLDLPADIKLRFRTVWELSMKTIISLAADRSPFIDQTQSMNLFMATPTLSSLTSMHFYAWEKGLKTGCYYLRSKPKTQAIKFNLMDDSAVQRFQEKGKTLTKNGKTYTDDVCTSCSA
jgi:ribonucleoside-diphosphate reductase alpha subunit